MGQWRIQNFIMGRTVEERCMGRGLCPSPEKIQFLPEIGGFWCILGLLFTFMQNLVRSMGGGRPPALNPPLIPLSIQAFTWATLHKTFTVSAITNMLKTSINFSILEEEYYTVTETWLNYREQGGPKSKTLHCHLLKDFHFLLLKSLLNFL